VEHGRETYCESDVGKFAHNLTKCEFHLSNFEFLSLQIYQDQANKGISKPFRNRFSGQVYGAIKEASGDITDSILAKWARFSFAVRAKYPK